MGIVPRDPDRPSSPPDHILGSNGEETAKTQRAQTALEIPIPKQAALLTDPKPPGAQRQLSIQIRLYAVCFLNTTCAALAEGTYSTQR